MNARKFLPAALALAALVAAATAPVAAATDWRQSVPRPVYAENPEFIALYDKAWELAWAHVKTRPGAAQPRYMDEAFDENVIWIWDTCFMSLFCKYAPDRFPGVESLRNFYLPLHAGAKSDLSIHIPDNPPLFAWVEWENFNFTGDTAHVRQLIGTDKFLQKHYAFFESVKPGYKIPGHAHCAPTCLKKHELGFFWEGGRSGMDNTPRGRTGPKATAERPNNPNLLWVDALAQQGLTALCLSRLATAAGDTAEAARWRAEYERVKTLVNTHYWDAKDGIYYDIDATTKAFVKVRTPAAYWPMLAEMCTPEQAAKLAEHARSPKSFGGEVPWTTVSRDDADFREDGNYWRGAMWLPTAYLGVKALEKYGYFKEADDSSLKVIRHMNATYKAVEPHTIWECYHPGKPRPSAHNGRRVSPDFCGWSALGPISLFIENVIGIRAVDAAAKTVRWDIVRPGELGLRNLRFGGITTDLLHDGNGVVTVTASAPYTLTLNGKPVVLPAGTTTLRVTPVKPANL